MVGGYEDIAISGGSAENRPGFQRMIADAISPEHPFDMIIVYDISRFTRECRHIHRHSRESGNPKAIGSKCVFASYRIPGSRFRGDDGNRRLETDILKLTTLPRSLAGKPLAGFCATRSRRIQDLYGMVVHVIRCNTHYAIDNRR